MPYLEQHRTVPAALPVERITSMELDDGARQRRIEALEREAHAQNNPPHGPSFAELLEDKQKPR